MWCGVLWWDGMLVVTCWLVIGITFDERLHRGIGLEPGGHGIGINHLNRRFSVRVISP